MLKEWYGESKLQLPLKIKSAFWIKEIRPGSQILIDITTSLNNSFIIDYLVKQQPKSTFWKNDSHFRSWTWYSGITWSSRLHSFVWRSSSLVLLTKNNSGIMAPRSISRPNLCSCHILNVRLHQRLLPSVISQETAHNSFQNSLFTRTCVLLLV